MVLTKLSLNYYWIEEFIILYLFLINMSSFSSDQLYLWKKKSSYKNPWQRQFLNRDFLEYEKKRIEDTAKWYKEFRKSKVGESLDEVYYYVKPIEMNNQWKTAINQKGDFNYAGLTAVKNSLQMPLVMLVRRDQKIPKDHSFIRIIKSKKGWIHNEKKNFASYVLILEDFEPVDPLLAYVDVPHEKKRIHKFILENFVDDNLIAGSFQPTLSSAPYVINDKGGISFSSFVKKNSFSKELVKTLKLMQPPELTNLQYMFPKRAINGVRVPIIDGMRIIVSERSVGGNNLFSGFITDKYKDLDHEIAKRRFYNGEYSFVCSLIPRGKSASELVRHILYKFVKTDIMHPFNTDELKSWDVDLSVAQKNIDENIWLQIANQRQLNPRINFEDSSILNLRKRLNSEWEIIYERLGFKKYVRHEAKVLARTSFDNILRVAQSIARDEGKPIVTDSILTRSFRLFSDITDNMVSNPRIQKQAKLIIPERYESEKFNAVMAELNVEVLNAKELFEKVNNKFKDLNELQEFIDRKLIPGGHIFEPRRGYYQGI